MLFIEEQTCQDWTNIEYDTNVPETFFANFITPPPPPSISHDTKYI